MATYRRSLLKHVHLDAVGGMAGDMFCAAMLDAFPHFRTELLARLEGLEISPRPRIEAAPFNDGIIQGHRFNVTLGKSSNRDHRHHHSHWRDIRRFLETSALEDPARNHALGIFSLLAEAEAAVHGVAIDDVQFHEVGNWDSIVDIVAAALLIHWVDAAGWSIAKLPLGSGRVQTAHGRLPIPAPATRRLLKGYKVFDDGLEGERITPTGAAILKYLNPKDSCPEGSMAETGYGHGHRTFPGISNILCAQAIDQAAILATDQTLNIVECEIDDQTPEDLAVALGLLRDSKGVKDAQMSTGYGKKGRLTFSLQLLVEPQETDAAIEAVFEQTSTIGVRWFPVRRRVLPRSIDTIDGIGVKTADRGSQKTTKAEMDDIAEAAQSHQARESLKRDIETQAMEKTHDD